MVYQSLNVFEYKDAFTFRCYVCNKHLGGGDLSRDHVIPQTLFGEDKTLRPTIKIHSECNSTLKSREDNWFSKVLMYRCQENKIMQDRLYDFISSADSSRMNPLAASKKDINNHRLLLTMLDGWYEVPSKASRLEKYHGTMRPTKVAIDREEQYIRMMARGLIIRNSWFAKVEMGDVMTFQFNSLKRTRKYSSFRRDMQTILFDNLNNCIYQKWGNDIMYVISPGLGMVYFEFYNQVAYSVEFKASFPDVMAKSHVTDSQIDEAQNFLLSKMKIWK